MFDRFSRSWNLVAASWSVLREDKSLLVFPLLSSLATLAVMACFALPLFGAGAFDGLARHGRHDFTTAQYVVGFLFYTVQYFVAFYFNAALVGAAMLRLDGKAASVGEGIAAANARLGSIVGYALIAATVGLVLRAIQERVGFLGRIVVGLLGAGWSVATYLVVPVLVTRDVGPIEAVQESAALLKRTWGENVIGQAGLGAAFGLLYFAAMVVAIGIVVLAASLHSVAAIVATIVLLVLAFITMMLVHGALAGIYSAALYRYAANDARTSGFDDDVLRLAFQPKR
jgi:hypothetical protein